jgi:hypothetical protein
MIQTYSNIVGWSEDGSELVVKDVRKAIENVLPKYFRHCKFESFVRQVCFGSHSAQHVQLPQDQSGEK